MNQARHCIDGVGKGKRGKGKAVRPRVMRSGILLRGRSPLGRRKTQTKALAACNAHQEREKTVPHNPETGDIFMTFLTLSVSRLIFVHNTS